MASPTLLLDSDIIAYKYAAANQKDFDWDGDGDSLDERSVDGMHFQFARLR